jgi:xanthosine utilization system XapX-like protein
MKTFSRLSTVTLIVGVLLTVVVSLITYHWPDPTTAAALAVGLVGIAITLTFELRVKMTEVGELIEVALSEAHYNSNSRSRTMASSQPFGPRPKPIGAYSATGLRMSVLKTHINTAPKKTPQSRLLTSRICDSCKNQR